MHSRGRSLRRHGFATSCLAATLAAAELFATVRVVAQPPPGTTGAAPIGPSARPSTVVVPPSYSESRSATPYLTPRATPAQGTAPNPFGSTAGPNPWATPSVVEPASYASAGRAITPPRNATYDPRIYAEYERLPRRGPFVALIVLASLGIVSGLPTLVRELRLPAPHDRGAIAYGATLTGLGVFAIALSSYKLVVRRKGIDRLREQGFEVSIVPAREGPQAGLTVHF